MSTLVVGAGGALGSAVCRELREAGHAVRALVRPGSNPERVAALEASGATLCHGDLRTPGSLESILRDVQTVVSTASAVGSRTEGDSIEAVDLRGHLHLIDAAKRASAKHFVYVSFYRQDLESPLQTAKRAVENELLASSMHYTIFQPVDFMETWLGPVVGFAPTQGKAMVLGNGEAKTSWVALPDVAKFVAKSVGNERTHNRTFALAGPESLSQLEVLELYRSLGCPSFVVEHLPEAVMEENFKASDPMARSIAALMLQTARGQRASSASALEVLPLQLTSVKQYAEQTLRSSQ